MSVPLSVTIAGAQAAEFKEKVRQEALNRGMSMSELVVEALADYLRKSSNGQ